MTARRVILDTDVASLSIKQTLPPALLREILGAQVGITFVTLGELTRWALLRNWGSRRRGDLQAWLSTRPTLPYSDDVAHTWGEITGRAAQRGRPRPANDSWIAATCLVYDLPLATFNRKDFEDYAEYEGLQLIGR